MKKLILAIAAVSMLAACSKDEIAQDSQKGPMQSIKVSVAPFSGETKTAITPTGGLTWSAGDQIGIYPVASTLGEGQTSQQIVFKINGTGDASSATFTGTGWGLITNGNYKYISYYPYSADAKYNEAPVVISDNLNQTENASTAHLGVNDYLYAPQIQPESAASANFDFYHLGALVEFEITMPEDAKTNTFTRMTVTASEPVFTASGKYDPTSATATVAPAITENVYTDKMTLKFNNGAGFTPDAEGKIHAYFLIAPAAVQGKTLNLKLWDVNNVPYIASKNPTKNIESGKTKKYECTAIVKPATMVTNLSVNASGNTETANCYIVPEWGRYKFLANVRGNGVDPVTDDAEGPDISMVTGYYADVIWETVNTSEAPAVGTIVSDPEIDGNYIMFTATGAQGNALIALKNSDGEIVWSWHIWSTDADIERLKQTYPNNAGVMMDRNLGALSATQGDALAIGFHYQWGRPFPYRGVYAFSYTSGEMATTNSGVWGLDETTSSKGTLAYSAANPTRFIYGATGNDCWYWNTDKSIPAFWGPVKTMYDPCPIGWKVPAGGATGVFDVAGFNNNTFLLISSGRIFSTPDSIAYYPACGVRYSRYQGQLRYWGSGANYWTTTQKTGFTCNALYWNATEVSTLSYYSSANGASVRPCQE